MKKISVLVVEDSLTIRRRFCEVLAADPELEVVGDAEDGREAIALCERLRPDVISLDMVLPSMSGLAVTEYVMAHCPTPILIVSSSSNRGEIYKTLEALSAGAVDVLEKPGVNDVEGEWVRKYRATLKLVSRIKVITHVRGRHGLVTPSLPPRTTIPPLALRSRAVRAVALGASTGGPGALAAVLAALPHPFPVPVLIVIHLDSMFGASFAEWLDAQTAHRVSFASDNQPVLATTGRVTMAPPGRHLIIRDGRMHLSDAPERHSCRPSIDTLFESIALEYRDAAVGCLLTGMGRDGAQGLLAMRRAGALTIAQDEATSIVYGMPREAVAIGAAARTLPLPAIAPTITEAVLRPEVAMG